MTRETQKNGHFIEYYSKDTKCPGDKWKEGDYKGGKKTGIWTWWHGKHLGGLKSKEEVYIDGQLNGLTIRWDKDGKINGKTNYKDGKSHGEETRYRYGYKDTIINYKNNIIDGQCTSFYSNGQKKSQGHAVDTSDYDYPYLLSGKWTRWFATGEKESEKYYHGKNVLVGEQTYWYRSGQMRCIYSNGTIKKYWDREGNDITSGYFLAYSKKEKHYLDFFKEQSKDDDELSTFFDSEIPPF
jgi:uncharacterized protein